MASTDRMMRRCCRGRDYSQLINESADRIGSDRGEHYKFGKRCILLTEIPRDILYELNLSEVTRTIFIKGGELGDDGLDVLLAGLVKRYKVVNDGEVGVWCLRNLTLANCGVTDVGVNTLMCTLSAGSLDVQSLHLYGEEINVSPLILLVQIFADWSRSSKSTPKHSQNQSTLLTLALWTYPRINTSTPHQ